MAIIRQLEPLSKPRIFLTGTGGQGTLTATRLLGEAALNAGLPVVAGEIHGMAQRGGIVESCLLIGGWQAARIDRGEADIILGFEALETLRALPYLKPGGRIFASNLRIPPLSVTLGKAAYPDLMQIERDCNRKSDFAVFLPTEKLAEESGNPRAANTVLLGAVCSSGLLPFGLPELEEAIKCHLPAKIQPVNITAMHAGAKAFATLY